MAVRARKRYRIGGDFSMRARDGSEEQHHFSMGDVLPDELAASLAKEELDAMRGTGMLREIGAPPPPKPAPEPPKRWTVVEILRLHGFPRADVVNGDLIGGPPGYRFEIIERAPRESDLKRITGVHPPDATPVVVSRVDGDLLATVPLAKFVSRLLMVPVW